MCAGVDSGGNFRKIPEGSSVGWCSFRRQLPERSGRFRRQLPEYSGGCHVASRGNFRNVPEGSSVCWCRFRRQLPEGSGGFRRVLEGSNVSEGSGKFRCGFLPCNLDRNNYVIVFEPPFGDVIVHMGETIAAPV